MDISSASDFSELLILLRTRRRPGSTYSYEHLARVLGFKSPRSLAMVLKKQRAPSAALVRSVGDYLKATPQEKEFLRALAERSRRMLNGQPYAFLDVAIDRFRAVRKIQIESRTEIAGILIEIRSETPDDVRRLLEETLREVIYSEKIVRTNPSATVGSDSSKHRSEESFRTHDEIPGSR